MSIISSSTFGSIPLSAQMQNQTSREHSKQQIPGCWDKVENVALNLFNATSNSTSDSKLGIFAVVLLYGFCIAAFVFQIIFALRK